MNEDQLVTGGGRLKPGRDLVGLVGLEDCGRIELDEQVEVGEQGTGSDLSYLHGCEIALDCAREGPSHSSAEVVGVHAGVDKAVEETED